jgi:hypothetical protein
MERTRTMARLALIASAATLLLGAVAAPVAAKPAPPSAVVTIVSVNETTCEITVRYDWSGFTGKHLLAEFLVWDGQEGQVHSMLGADLRDVSGSEGTFTHTVGGLVPHGEAARPIFATAGLWTGSVHTRLIVGSDTRSDDVISECQG